MAVSQSSCTRAFCDTIMACLLSPHGPKQMLGLQSLHPCSSWWKGRGAGEYISAAKPAFLACPGLLLHVPTSLAFDQSRSRLLPWVSELSGGCQPPRSPPRSLAFLPSFPGEAYSSRCVCLVWVSMWTGPSTYLLSPLRIRRASSRTRSGPACFQLLRSTNVSGPVRAPLGGPLCSHVSDQEVGARRG